MRALAKVVEQRSADGTSRIRSALAAAAELRDASAAAAAERERKLAEREAALRHITDLLNQAAAGS